MISSTCFDLLTQENFDKLTRTQQREYLHEKVEQYVLLMRTVSKVLFIFIYIFK